MPAPIAAEAVSWRTSTRESASGTPTVGPLGRAAAGRYATAAAGDHPSTRTGRRRCAQPQPIHSTTPTSPSTPTGGQAAAVVAHTGHAEER